MPSTSDANAAKPQATTQAQAQLNKPVLKKGSKGKDVENCKALNSLGCFIPVLLTARLVHKLNKE
jgi:hypothetical protein